MRKDEWLGILAILFMLIGGSLLTYYFIIEEIHSCTVDPVKYYISRSYPLNASYNYTYIYIALYLNREDVAPVFNAKINLSE